MREVIVTENIAPDKASKWYIDLKWYDKNKRSFMDLAKRGICGKCAEKLNKKKKPATKEDVLAAIKDCCSQTPEFITPKMPILESVFRIILANGNKPMGIDEISRELNEKRGSDTYSSSKDLLIRLLSNDRWYGFCEEK
jgi:hypothetical protein